MQKVAERHNLKVSLHEKPFKGVNGSGKHNNWSLATDTGVNLLSPSKTPMSNLQFLAFFINTIKAVNDYETLLRAAIATASNDHRLGANEAPPAIISVFIGGQLTKVLAELELLNTTTTFYADNGCSDRIPITAIVNTIPTITSTNTPVSRCGAGSVTLQAISDIGIINWYDFGGNFLASGTSFPIPNIATKATYYAEAFNNGCSNGIRVPIYVFVYTPPIVTNEEVNICKLSTATLDAAVPGMSYLWSTDEKTQKITVSTSGIYTVDVTSPAPENCTSRKKITVVEHNVPEIDRVVVNETTVVIYLKQEEVYFEYSIDGINYQSSNVFFNAQSGLQTAYVREINFCSRATLPFIVLIAPKFFTPNGDSYNDFWEVKGLINYPQAEVSIFDRYGKLISVLNATKRSWDGMLNKSPLPADDYWYVLKIDETTPEKRGHFSLKR